MFGETHLDILLRTMTPELQDGEFVFCTLAPEHLAHLPCEPVCQFREPEGITLILARKQAEEYQLEYAYVSRMITLTVHSSLNAVGFLAAITTTLAAQGISVNAVSAYYHDHLFVSVDRAHDAMRVLQELSSGGWRYRETPCIHTRLFC